MHVGVFQALPGRLGGLQEPPGASRGLQGLPGTSRGLQGAPGFERPEAGCLGEFAVGFLSKLDFVNACQLCSTAGCQASSHIGVDRTLKGTIGFCEHWGLGLHGVQGVGSFRL